MKQIVLLFATLAMIGCSNLGTNVQNILNSPAVQAILSQAEAFAIQFAESWIASHLGGARHLSKVAYQPGVTELSTALQVQFKLPSDLADTEAQAAFAKASK